MTTASVASFALVGAAFGSAPAFANNGHAASTGSGAGTAAGGALAAAATGFVSTPQTPAVRLVASASTVAAAQPVNFTATATLANGVPDALKPATLQVTTVRGWETIRSTQLSATGTAAFTFHPKHDHNYRVVLPAVQDNGTTVVNSVMSANVAVKVKAPDIGPAIVAEAAKEVGKRYVFGAEGPNTFDCSGLVKFVFAKFGISLPHHANDMKHYGVRVSEKDAKPGDLVFVFTGTFAHHVAIYAGNGTWWEAPHTGSWVRHVKIWSSDIEFRRVR
jgi:cell wall-associated NlpC family hydrolase